MPELGKDRLMRDPCICRGPDGTFHLVWTIGWSDASIGYASSRDLVHWSQQRELPVMADEPTTRNCWAPEITYNPDDEFFYVYWSSTIPDRHSPIPEMERKEAGLNHRIYMAKTKDFISFSPSRIWFNPAYSAIDAAAVRDDMSGDWLFFVKNENHTPVQKDIRFFRFKTLAEDVPPLDGATLTPHWTEGPSPLFVGDELYLYFDDYRGHRFGALRSLDRGRTWKDVSDQLRVPRGIRHGTAFAVDRSMVYDLLAATFPGGEAEAKQSDGATPGVSLAGLSMGAEKLLRYGEKVRVEGELTYLVSEGADFRLAMDENGELKVVAVPGWWTPARIAAAIAIALLLFAAVLGWAFLLRHQKIAESRVSDAVQKERLRLSQDLHDGYQQLLAGCMFRLTAAMTLAAKLEKSESPALWRKLGEQFDGLRSSLTHAQDELRAALWTMKEEAEGPAAMGDLFRYAASRLPQWEGKVSFSVEGAESPLSRRYTGALLMILQEAVGNALRHGKAKHVRVRVVFGWRGLAMLVMDDGCGFDAASAASAPGVHLGLQSMRSRAEKIGGQFAVRSVPGHGTEVKVMLEAKP